MPCAKPQAKVINYNYGLKLENELVRIMAVLSSLAASPKISDKSSVTFYEHGWYGGKSFKVIGTESADATTLHQAHSLVGNDAISSLKVGPGLLVTLYQHGGNEGPSVVFGEGDVLVLTAYTLSEFNDKTSSIRIEALEKMPESRKGEVLNQLKESLYAFEVDATWIEVNGRSWRQS